MIRRKQHFKASVEELEVLLASFHQDVTGGRVLFGEWIRNKIKDVIPDADPCAGMTDIQIRSHLLQGCYTLLCPLWETAIINSSSSCTVNYLGIFPYLT